MRCRVCGHRPSAPGGRPWARVRGLAYFRCPRCAFILLNPAAHPSPEAAAARYRQHRNDPSDAGYRGFLSTFVEAAILPYAAPGARILDFGSGPVPALSLLLSELGYAATPWDPVFAPSRAGLRGDFDLIAVHEVAEHLSRPYASLARLGRRLKAGGYLALRTRFAPEEAEAFARWWYREDPTHVAFFGPGSLRALAARLGLVERLQRPPDLAVFQKPPDPGGGLEPR